MEHKTSATSTDRSLLLTIPTFRDTFQQVPSGLAEAFLSSNTKYPLGTLGRSRELPTL